jgi:hypothetical protein
MDVIAANFENESEAAEAAEEMTDLLHVDRDMVSVDHLGEAAEAHAGEPVLVAWVSADDRSRAREVIERHAGRHVPLDWLQAVQEDVAPESFDRDAAVPPTGDEAAEERETAGA